MGIERFCAASAKKLIMIVVIAISLCAALFNDAAAQQPRSPDGIQMAPDNILFRGGRFYDHQTEYNFSARQINRREPKNSRESSVLTQADRIFENSSAKTLVLIDSSDIVMIQMKYPANLTTLHGGASFGKVFASLAIGALVCDGQLSLSDPVKMHVPELASSDLSDVTVRDLLRMSSGMKKGYPDTTVYTDAQRSSIQSGSKSILDVLKEENISTAEKTLFGGKSKPGRVFRYMSTDPIVLGVVVNKISGKPYAKYLEEKIFIPSGIQGPSVIEQDHFGYGHSDHGIRMKIEDWIRFALWLKESSNKQDCFGNYVREASRTQIMNQTREVGGYFGGFGYMLWTENRFFPKSFWTIGYGGQRIGWNYDNNRILLVFSNLEEASYLAEIYQLYRSWSESAN